MNVFEGLASSMAFENVIEPALASQIVVWLENEGILDYDILKEVYLEEGETLAEQVPTGNDNSPVRLVVDNEGVRD
jgi:hypothetical protein